MVKIRRAYEVLFLGLFLFFLLITDLRYLKGWPVSLFLEATPLVAVATALTTHTIYRNLVWGLVIIAITMMLGGSGATGCARSASCTTSSAGSATGATPSR